ncbi:MAG: hypothetical protein JWR22_1501 [Herminiimonas sp.]|nr:hypothetical protein [Herminiimonas sp.]
MDWVAQTITAFGQDIGVPDLALGPDNRLSLEMQSGGALDIIYLPEVPSGQVLLVRGRPLDRDASRVAAKALRIADFRQTPEVASPGWTARQPFAVVDPDSRARLRAQYLATGAG